MLPNFDFEKKYWDKGYVVIGVDEVGRGAVAGPIVAAAVLLRSKSLTSLKLLKKMKIDDSKRVMRKRREELEPRIKKYFYWGIGEATVGEINKLGIVAATRLAMKRAVKKFKIQNSKFKITSQKLKIIIDGRRVRGIGRQRAIVKGDQKSTSIAAASIIAKVYRDKLMRDLSGKYRGYGFERHVGYGTKHHGLMIRKLGMCEIHRVGFVRSLLKIRLRVDGRS